MYANPVSSHYGGLRRQRARNPLTSNGGHEEITLSQFQNHRPVDASQNEFNEQQASDPALREFRGWSTDDIVNSAASQQSRASSDTDVKEPQATSNRSRHEDFLRVKAVQSVWQIFVWPAFVICVPMILLSTALLYIVHTYKIKPGQNIFDHVSHRDIFKDKKFLVVNFSATKLVFLASFLSTLAPLLAGCIMNLVAILVYQDLQESSNMQNFSQLPTPYQVSLLIGVLAASYEQLFNSFTYLWSSKRTAKTSPVLLYALSIFLLTVILGVAVAATDAYLHIATQTVEVTVYFDDGPELLELGKGINSFCLGANRTENFGFPCSMAFSTAVGKSPEWQISQAEMQSIAHNTSTVSIIQLANANSVRIAYLLPATLPESTNFQANTIGVGTQCELISPSACNTSVWGDNDAFTSFNCSPNFWGTLGMTPPESKIGQGKVLSPYLSFLAINQNANLIYQYFADELLDIVYNTADLNASAIPEDDARPWSDSELKNPVYLGFAWRTATSSFAGFSKNGMVTSGSLLKSKSKAYADYFVKCKVTSYDVTYTMANGTLQNFGATEHKNGTVLNIWTGMADYTPRVSGSDWNLQDYNIQSVIAGNTSESYELRFGELISQDVLSTIGAFTSGREVVGQQRYATILVAKVPKSALGALLGCALLYPVLGVALLVKAKNAHDSLGKISPLLSYWGLTYTAFLQHRGITRDGTLQGVEACSQEDTLRLFIQKDNHSGTHFGLYERSNGTTVTEVERSQINVTNVL